MYVPDANVDHTSLWQGDVVKDVQIFGALHYQGITHNMPIGGGEASAWTVQAKPATGDVMVLSHSCELDRSNSVKVTSIILAPIRDLNSATAPEKIKELIASNLVSEKTEASYLKYFYLEPSPQLPVGGAVVDFSKCFSVRNKSYDYLLQRKSLELNETIRGSMALKLALYFHREA